MLVSSTNSTASVERFDAKCFDPSFAIAEEAFEVVSLDFSGDSDSITSLIVYVVMDYIFTSTNPTLKLNEA